MKSKAFFVILLDVLVLAIGAAAANASETLTFQPTTIQYPGSTTTVARGINSNGDVVGTYSCAKNVTHPCTGVAPGNHGFLILAGTPDYLAINVPEAGVTATVPRAISDQGLVVGQYGRTEIAFDPLAQKNVTGIVARGFACASPCSSPDSYVYPIEVPSSLFQDAETQSGPYDPTSSPCGNSTDATQEASIRAKCFRNTLLVGVSPEGDLVGCYHEDNATMTTMHGWRLRNSQFSELATGADSTGAPAYTADTMSNGIAPTGAIAGGYFSSGVSYIADQNGIVETFTFPGNLFTLAWAVNARGDVVGEHGDNQAYSGGQFGMCSNNCSDTNPVGFIRTADGDYITLKVDKATLTQVFGINSWRGIVGAYVDSVGCGAASCTHGYVYRLPNSNRL